MLGNYWVASQLVASGVVLSSIELVSYSVDVKNSAHTEAIIILPINKFS
jgi:hypothetical protein